ncbi:MAG: hypothetical protein IKC59_08895, partial [Clostridia bacterium]|nr:hypothetical protein [Clostridia bacterium]
KTVIGLGFRVLRGAYRGIEEGSTYYQYTTMGVENMEETVMPMVSVRLSMLLEEEGYSALPQRRHQQIMAEENSTNPEVAFDAVYRNRPQETQMDFNEAAVLCGLGEIGFHGALLTDAFGPFVRTCFVLTDAEIEATPVQEPHLCDQCGECVKGCPGGAIAEDGKVDAWQCAVYYNGANGLKNPFMPPDAFANFENRLDIIEGKVKVTPESARKILDSIYFYPPAQHAYQCSICGRACDVACYMHLEKKGVLKRKYKDPFRKRDEWNFSIEDFEI